MNMKKFEIYVVDLNSDEVVYSKTITAKTKAEAENIAWKWSVMVEAEEGIYAGWDIAEV